MLKDNIFELMRKLEEFHKNREVNILDYKSPITGNQFSGEFNVSGYHNEILLLPEKGGKFFGIDKCLRLKENTNKTHSYLFHMGIFAKSTNLNQNFIDPFKDERFKKFQEEIISQFIDLLNFVGINLKDVEATYLGGLDFGASKKGRDKILKKQYSFPSDTNSEKLLKKYKIHVYPVHSLKNIDIRPVEEALVGPRIELTYKGIEIATIVFDCFKIKDGKLIPINYVGGYAAGIERLLLVLNNKESLIETKDNYSKLYIKLIKKFPAIASSIFEQNKHNIVFGIEVLVIMNDIKNLSKKQKEVIRKFKTKFRESCNNLGIGNEEILELIEDYQNENINYRC